MAAFDNGIAAIRSAANGHRNETLNNEVLGLAGLIHHNVFTVADLEREAIEAAISVGLPKQEAVDTYKSALKAGLQTPRDPLEKNTPRSSKNTKAAAPQKPASAIDEAQASKDIAEGIWRAGAPATAQQEYVTRKLGLPDGLRTDKAGNLIAPLYTLDGELIAVQTIPAQGKKKFATGTRPGQFPDAGFIVGGQIHDGDTIYIVEGLGQGWTAHQATRQPAAVCFGVGRMAGVAKALREHYPEAQLVMVADVGKEAQMAEIARAVNGSWVECPPELGDGGDINDLHVRDGLAAAAEILDDEKRGVIEPPYWPQTRCDISTMLRQKPQEVQFLVADRLQANRGHALVGIGGTSKTRLVVQMAIGAVIGRVPWAWRFERTGSAVLVLTEDTEDDVHRKLDQMIIELELTKGERQAVAERLHVFALAGEDSTTLLELDRGVLRETERAKGLFRLCKSIADLRFIGLDPALSLTEGDELDQTHQRQLGRLVDRLAIESNACAVMVAHAAKALQSADEIGSHSSRGAGAITDALRAEYVLRTMTAAEARNYGISDIEERKAHVQLVATKGNDLPPSAFVPTWLHRGAGGVLKAAELIEPEGEAQALGKRDTDALQALRELCRNGAYQFSTWKDECIRRGLIKAGNLEAEKKSMQRVIRALLAHGLIQRGPIRGVFVPVGEGEF
jgi:hypothetical protein